MVITEALVKKFPDANEGELSRLRAWYVRGTTLADIAEESQLGDHLLLGEGEMKSGGFRRRSILADTVEAIIGAVYQTNGFEDSRRYVLEIFASRLVCPPDFETLKDPKTRLQELLQGKGEVVPDYSLQATNGKAHEQTFTVLCVVSGLKIETSATGASRRKAEQLAAAAALELVNEL